MKYNWQIKGKLGHHSLNHQPQNMKTDLNRIKTPKYNQFLWMLKCKPELYETKMTHQRFYIVFSKQLGFFKKKEAELICAFLKDLYKFLI